MAKPSDFAVIRVLKTTRTRMRVKGNRKGKKLWKIAEDMSIAYKDES